MTTDVHVIPLHLQVSVQRRMMLNHALPGIALLVLGFESLSGGESSHGVPPWVDIVAGAAVIFAIMRELRRKPGGAHAIIGWVDVLAGIVIIVEGANHYHPNKGFQPAYLYWPTGVLTILLGVFHKKFAHLRQVRFTPAGFSARTRIFRRFSLSWDSIESVRFDPRAVTIMTKGGGRHSLPLKRVANADEVRDAIRMHAASHGITVEDVRPQAAAVRGKA